MSTAESGIQRDKAGCRSISLGRLHLNFDTFQATVAGEWVGLTHDEFEMLALLASEPDRVVIYEILSRQLWGISGRPANRRLNVLVHRIRAKLGDIWPYEIRTVRERGYGLLKSPGVKRGE